MNNLKIKLDNRINERNLGVNTISELPDNQTIESFSNKDYKFGEGGYAKFYFKDKQYEGFLKELRNLLKDKNKYIETQRNYISKLKEEEKI